jgi:phosphoribosylamine--glycine ligase
LETVGILLVCYGSRGSALADSLSQSNNYKVELFIADKQKNPFNIKIAKEHAVIPSLDIEEIYKFVVKHRNKIDFAVIGPEAPIIDGVKDTLEAKAKIPTVSPSKKQALEGSKVKQRLLMEKICPEVNPRFRVFDSDGGLKKDSIKDKAKTWINELGGVERVVIKPDKPGFGKGVGVGGEHFRKMGEALLHFETLLVSGLKEKAIIEEKIEGEESSFQAWCDGNILIPMPDTRDYKRAFDGDLGPNTGGMGSYRDADDYLPFMNIHDYEKEVNVANKLLEHLKEGGRNPDLIGVPFYIAFIHTASDPKILEINSRPGDPEIMNILPTMETDMVDLCYNMLNGTLTQVKYLRKASVVTYTVPMTYGGYRKKYSGSNMVRLEEAYQSSSESEGKVQDILLIAFSI